MDKIILPHPTPRMDAAWKRRGGTAMYDEGCALERENQTLRNAQKSCADCESVFTIREFRDLEKHRAALIEENDNLATERDSLRAALAASKGE